MWILSGPCDALPVASPAAPTAQPAPGASSSLQAGSETCFGLLLALENRSGPEVRCHRSSASAVLERCWSGAGLRTSRGSTRVQKSHLGARGTRAPVILVCTGVCWSALGPTAALPWGQDTHRPIPEPWGSPRSARPAGPTGKAPSDRVAQAVSIPRGVHQQPPSADIWWEAAEMRGPVLRTQPVRGLCVSLQGTAQPELCGDIAGLSGRISVQIFCS